MKQLFFISTLAILSSCGLAGNSKIIQPNEPQATIKFGQELRANQAISAKWYDNQVCEKGENSGITAIGWLLGNNKILPIPAGKPVYIQQSILANSLGANYECGAATCVASSRCTALVSFTPENGRAYSAKLIQMDNKCQVVIFEIKKQGEMELDEQQHLKACD